MTQRQKTENFFILLGIDPNQQWSDELFKKVLLTKRAEWTSQRMHPQKGPQSKRYLDLVPQINLVMLSEESRKAEATEALAIIAEGESAARAELEQLLRISAAKGYILKEETDKLVEQFKGRLSEASVRAEVRKMGVPDRRPGEGQVDSGQKMDSSTMSLIQDNLDTLGIEDLYEFLKLSPATRVSELRGRADEILSQNRQTAVKDAKLSASSTLAGLVRTVFADDESKKRYDRALDERNFELLGEAIKGITAVEKRIYRQQYLKLLEQALELKLDVARAERYIDERARAWNIGVEFGGAEAVARKIRCAKCGTLNDDRPYCRSCSSPLKLDCPSCKNSMAVEDSVCSGCGFPIGNAVMVTDLLKESQRLILAGSYTEASVKLRTASSAWNTIPPRKHSDPLSLEIEKQAASVNAILEKREALRGELRAAVEGYRFYQARRILEEIDPRKALTEYALDREKINMTIASVEKELRRAREMQTRNLDAVGVYQAILNMCRDCGEAREGLTKSPPLPPPRLAALPRENSVSLSWTPSPAAGVSYIVVRKASARPTSPSDGERVASLKGTAFDDTKPIIGLPVYYAVYADRDGVLSNTAALISEPILTMAEVLGIQTEVDDGQVRVTWTQPPNARSIRVYRSLSRPRPGAVGGELVKLLDDSQFIDRGVQNGKAYFYTIVAVFRDHNGKEVLSPGTVVEATPDSPPRPIEILDVKAMTVGAARKLNLAISPPAKGLAFILRSERPIPEGQRSVLSQVELGKYGSLIPVQNNKTPLETQSNLLLFLTPVVLFQGIAYLGKTVEYASVDDVSNLRFVRLVNEFQLTWDWPQNCRKAIVAYGYAGYVRDSEAAGANRQEVTRAQYDLAGHYKIKNPLSRDHFITVFAVMEQTGKSIIASGLSDSARLHIAVDSLVKVSYGIERRGRFRKSSLVLTVRAEGKGLMPAMALVSKAGSQPISRFDGAAILNIPATAIGDTPLVLTFDMDGQSRPNSYARIFLEDERLYDTRGGYVSIAHPPREKAGVF